MKDHVGRQKTTEQGRFDKEMPCCLGMFRRFSAGYKPEFYFLSHDMQLVKVLHAVTVQAVLGTEEAEECSGVQSGAAGAQSVQLRV